MEDLYNPLLTFVHSVGKGARYEDGKLQQEFNGLGSFYSQTVCKFQGFDVEELYYPDLKTFPEKLSDLRKLARRATR